MQWVGGCTLSNMGLIVLDVYSVGERQFDLLHLVLLGFG